MVLLGLDIKTLNSGVEQGSSSNVRLNLFIADQVSILTSFFDLF